MTFHLSEQICNNDKRQPQHNSLNLNSKTHIRVPLRENLNNFQFTHPPSYQISTKSVSGSSMIQKNSVVC